MGRVRADGAVRRGDRERFRDRPATPAGLYDGPSAVSSGGVSPCAPAECLGTTWRSTNGNVMAVDDDGEGDVAGGEDDRSAVRTHRGRMRGEGRASPGTAKAEFPFAVEQHALRSTAFLQRGTCALADRHCRDACGDGVSASAASTAFPKAKKKGCVIENG